MQHSDNDRRDGENYSDDPNDNTDSGRCVLVVRVGVGNGSGCRRVKSARKRGLV